MQSVGVLLRASRQIDANSVFEHLLMIGALVLILSRRREPSAPGVMMQQGPRLSG
jgi:hypothetical protein